MKARTMKLIKATKVLILLPVIIFSLLINDSFCQEFDPHDLNDVTYVNFGATTLNIGNLNANSSFSANKYLPFSTNAWTLGTGTRNINGKIMMGSEGNFTFENKNINTNGFNSYLSSSFSIILNVGYVVYSTENFKVYPFIGGGVGRVNMDIIKNEKTPTFNEIMTKPERGVPVSNTSALLQLGVAADYLIKIGKSEPQKGGIVVGLKAGYVFSVYSTGFQLKGADLTGSPDINNNGAYIKVYLGYTAGILAALGDLF